MPIYEYQCQSCQHEMEALQKMSDAPLRDCPACQQPQLKKKISAAGFRLTGSGWYETDFKSGNKKKNLAGDNGNAGADAKATPASADKAGAAKPAAAPAKTGAGTQ
ncbi:zinc ribbon domain-containing protein [Exilibacterium tricleocarpae]|uniref:Zinc ribbon domain-containing protein n=1 Tax=Exilibacterium tricleocarpae TaxID=2591008 RepID=A0A545U9F8_9GAMM|nr:zinc ribbon domain-containing protein [Exilibacterium tricleocarpae]TQV86105.1 zinc ribbon domain-containing protein [Exilibacterium tricleocarpae]